MVLVTRIGDVSMLNHCSGMTRAQGSSNVFVNSIGVSRQGDNNTVLLKLSIFISSTHSAGITTGSTKVFVNGKGIGRVGDGISGCTSVVYLVLLMYSQDSYK